MCIRDSLYNLLREQEEKEAQYIATALEIYVTGSLNVFKDVYKRQQQINKLIFVNAVVRAYPLDNNARAAVENI